MIIPAIPDTETERLIAVNSYELMGSAPEREFDDLSALAAEICGTPIALVTLVGENQQWFKSHHGTELQQSPRDIAFCSHAIMEPNGLLVVSDAENDPRFVHNPLVTGDTKVIFYAGVSLVNPEGHALGTLCVIGHEKKELSPRQISALKVLGKQVLMLMELRRKTIELEARNVELERKNSALEQFAKQAVHDLKNPLTTLLLNSQALCLRLKDQVNDRNYKMLDHNVRSVKELDHMISELLTNSLHSR